jgi:hypothetical protein
VLSAQQDRDATNKTSAMNMGLQNIAGYTYSEVPWRLQDCAHGSKLQLKNITGT